MIDYREIPLVSQGKRSNNICGVKLNCSSEVVHEYRLEQELTHNLHHLLSHIGQNYSRLTDQYLKKARSKDTYAILKKSDGDKIKQPASTASSYRQYFIDVYFRYP